MRPVTHKLAMILVALVAMSLALVLVFRVVYEPELALRVLHRQSQPDNAEMNRLLRMAKADRFDLTDSLLLAHILEDAGRIEDALAVFERLQTRYSTVPAIGLWYAERLQQYGKWDEAEKRYLRLLEFLDNRSDDESPDSHLWSAREQDLAVAKQSGTVPDGLDDVSRFDLYKKLAENAMAAGMAVDGAARRQRLEKSEKYFLACLAIEPDNHDARGAYANLLLQINQPKESLRNYQVLLEADSGNLGWLVSAALAAGAAREFGLAERYMREALRVENRPEWRLQLAQFMSWGGKHDAALNEINDLIEENPASVEFRRTRADLLVNAGRYREYLRDTARLAAADPLDLNLRLKRVHAMIGLGLYQDAVNESSAMLAIDPENRDAALMKAEALLWSGDYRAARADLAVLAAKAPEDRYVLKRLAQSQLWDKRYEEALEGFRRLNPAAMDDMEVSQGFAEAVAGRKAPSLEDVNTILAMHQIIEQRKEVNWPVPMLAAMGRALREAGENKTAVELLQTATQRAASNLRLRLELADLLHEIGRYDDADRQYRIITDQQKEGSSK